MGNWMTLYNDASRKLGFRLCWWTLFFFHLRKYSHAIRLANDFAPIILHLLRTILCQTGTEAQQRTQQHYLNNLSRTIMHCLPQWHLLWSPEARHNHPPDATDNGTSGLPSAHVLIRAESEFNPPELILVCVFANPVSIPYLPFSVILAGRIGSRGGNGGPTTSISLAPSLLMVPLPTSSL